MTSFTTTVITERLGRLLLIGLNRPQKHNTIDRLTADRLTHVIRQEFETDSSIYAGVLYGCGEDFCTGLDFEDLTSSGLTCLDKYASDGNGAAPMGPSRMALSKPLVAALTGRAIGGGLELALACDLRVAETDATLGLHPRKYCVPMMDMGAERLPILIGLSRALDLVLTGRCLTGAEGYEFGLVNRLVKPGTAIGVAVDLANSMCKLPGQAALLADRNAAIQTAIASDIRTGCLKHYSDAVQALVTEGVAGMNRLIHDADSMNWSYSHG